MSNLVNRPYDLSNPHELKEALSVVAGAYVEYRAYWARQINLLEDFDETLEDSDFAGWMRRGHCSDGTDTLTAKALASLNESAELLLQTGDVAQNNLSMILKAVFASPPDIQMMVWDAAYDVSSEETDELLGTLFEHMGELGFDSVDRDMDVYAYFLACFREIMEARG